MHVETRAASIESVSGWRKQTHTRPRTTEFLKVARRLGKTGSEELQKQVNRPPIFQYGYGFMDVDRRRLPSSMQDRELFDFECVYYCGGSVG